MEGQKEQAPVCALSGIRLTHMAGDIWQQGRDRDGCVSERRKLLAPSGSSSAMTKTPLSCILLAQPQSKMVAIFTPCTPFFQCPSFRLPLASFIVHWEALGDSLASLAKT